MAKKESLEWLRYALDDYEAALYLTGMHAKKLEIICYHCQQCAILAAQCILETCREKV